MFFVYVKNRKYKLDTAEDISSAAQALKVEGILSTPIFVKRDRLRRSGMVLYSSELIGGE